MGTIRIGLARYEWEVPAPNALSHPPWPDWAFSEIFQAGNGWSVHDYWLRSTFGFVDARFDIRPWRILRGGVQAQLMNNNRAIIAACRQQALDDGEPLVGYDQVIAFAHAPPCQATALAPAPNDAALDQNADLLWYLHEVGHVLGFEHSWGPTGERSDPYCVMSNQTVDSHQIVMPPRFNGITMLKGPAFWNSARALSAAALYRYVPDFANSTRVVRTDLSQGSYVSLTALTQGHWGGTLLAAVASKGEIVDFTIEYRTRFGDDEAISRPAVVVHSIGRRFMDPKLHHEVNPVWFEAAIDPVTGQTQVIDQDLQVEVTSSDDREVGVYLTRPT
jgi:hypothetical protein